MYKQTVNPKLPGTAKNILLTFLAIVLLLALYVSAYVFFGKENAVRVSVITLLAVFLLGYFILKSRNAQYEYILCARKLTVKRIVNKRTVKQIDFDLNKCEFAEKNSRGMRLYPKNTKHITLIYEGKNYCISPDENMMKFINEKNVTDAFIEENRQAMLDFLKEIIAVPSVKEAPQEGMPFGKPCADALEKTLDLCESLGMKTKNVDSYCGWAEAGKGDKLIGILCHLDVVPAGDGWDSDPFCAVFTDTEVFGRGAIDDKGPAVAAIYAVAAAMEASPNLPVRVRLIFGCDEESGWECMDKYISCEEIPDIAFTPDAEYPVIVTEKGIAHFCINTSLTEGDYQLYIQGGLRPNMVPGKAHATVIGNIDRLFDRLSAFDARKNNIEFSVKDGVLEIDSYGVGAHGSTPEKGVNAFFNLFKLLELLNLGSSQGEFVKAFNRIFTDKFDGSGANLKLSDSVSGSLTLSVGMCFIGKNDVFTDMQDDSCRIVIDIRYPATFSLRDISARLESALPETWEIALEHGQDPLHMPEDSLLVKTLMGVYRKYTGRDDKPLAIGGGTYARAIPGKAVAFGVQFPGREDKAHQPNESLSLDDFFISAKMFAAAILELAEKL